MAEKKSGKPQLTHIDVAGRPAMVDVGDKALTVRTASASADVRFPKAVAERLREQDMRSTKGAIIDTAVIATGSARDLARFRFRCATYRCGAGQYPERLRTSAHADRQRAEGRIVAGRRA